MTHTVDIIIPVYKGDAETRRCLESVLAARHETRLEIVVIDDASPEPALSRWLADLGRAGRVTLIVHPANVGFVASVNEGMALHPDRDVVLLNSDTEVADGWIDRLAAHGARDPRIGTATPFSNNATICSYPRPLMQNLIPRGESIASIDAAFAQANAGIAIDLPTGVGFCLFIARRCLAAVGAFDAARYGRGYGEEVDFCMRAARAGFRNVAAADVFVRHVGEVSFGDSGAARRGEAQAVVDGLYPEFQPALKRFLDGDALLPARRRADLARLARSSRPRLLLVTHAFGGGVRRHVDWLARHAGDDCEVLVLQPGETSPVTRSLYAMLRWANDGEEMRAWFRQADEWPRLLEVLRGIGISRVHLHHVHGFPREVLDLPHELGCPLDITFHDYFAVCPQYHLVDGSGRYCGEPGGDCRRCEDAAPAQWPLSIPQWREAFRGFVAQAQRVIAPSRDCAIRATRYFPGAEPVIANHPDAAGPPATRHARVVVPGALSPEKGLDLLEACVREAAASSRPLHFIVAGYLARPLPLWPALPVEVSGEYPEGSLPELLASLGGNVVFFPAQCPETFSYTLGDAIASGMPIVATDLGALGERLAGVAGSAVLPWDASPARFNEALLAAASRNARAEAVRSPADVNSAFYESEYLEPLRQTPPSAPPAPPPLRDQWWLDPREPLAVPSLAQLYDDGVLCGRRQSRVALRLRLEEVDREGGALERELALARAGRDAIEHSTTWRLTAPLRRLLTALRLRR
ncbi:MAG TPA: glycosyltransferase [Usitatibacter sp.]|nr:glycosyltransferase [Usitatibacter sp.]